MNEIDTTMTRALTDAEAESIAAAARAFSDGEIDQRQVAPGIYVLTSRNPS